MRYETDSFDTVVDTFGICSYDEPHMAVLQMGRVLKPGGKLVLLEHGQASSSMANYALEKGALKQLHKFVIALVSVCLILPLPLH